MSSAPVASKEKGPKVTKGFPKQDAYTDLDLLEQALSLTFALPLWLPKEPIESEAKRKEFLGGSFPTLRNLLSDEWYHFNRLINAHKPEPMGFGGLSKHFLFKAEHWAGTSSHDRNRSELIELLIELRALVLETLRVIPPPRDRRAQVVRWEDLTPRRCQIVRLLAKRPMAGTCARTRRAGASGSGTFTLAMVGPLRAIWILLQRRRTPKVFDYLARDPRFQLVFQYGGESVFRIHR